MAEDVKNAMGRMSRMMRASVRSKLVLKRAEASPRTRAWRTSARPKERDLLESLSRYIELRTHHII